MAPFSEDSIDVLEDETKRLYCYGYRSREAELPVYLPVKNGTKLSALKKPPPKNRRKPRLTSLGCEVHNAALPTPNDDPETLLDGVRKRFAFRPPDSEADLLKKLKAFTQRWLKKNLTPLAPTVDTSVAAWLERTNYPLWRRTELMEKWSKVGDIRDPLKFSQYIKCKSFMKEESYPEFKHARAINSRSDEFKCAVGPIFKLIEDVIYKHRAFIKHVPVADRPTYIRKLLERQGATYLQTDYTAFESLFVAELMNSCEFELYHYMTQYLPGGKDWYDLVSEVLAGENLCEFKHFSVKIPATRMSGEMCTSLGNGFGNLMFMLFVCEELCHCKEVEGVVEGDDGLFTMVGEPPTSEDFKRLGLVIKLVPYKELSHASFCGLIFDQEECINVTDPIQELLSFGWTKSGYARASSRKLKVLLRCKGLSLAHQYPGCPIVSSLAQYALRVTRGVDVRHYLENDRNLSLWERDQIRLALRDEKKIIVREPGVRTRFLVEDVFKVRVEHQIKIEEYLDSLDSLQPIKLDLIDLLIPKVCRDYFAKYHYRTSPRATDLEYPPLAIMALPGREVTWEELTRIYHD